MTILFTIVTLLFFLLYLWERVKNNRLRGEILYIKERIHTAFYTRENGYILIPSENIAVKELSAELNRLLETLYLQKADYERSKRAMVQVLTNISHDLRTPLTVLKGCSELLLKEVKKTPAPPSIYNMAAKIDSKTDELAATINAYFTMSKIESGDMRMDLQKTNITVLCQEIILEYYDILEKEQFEVEIQMNSDPVFAYADAEALKRIVKNLIDNAMKHGGSGKYLGIRLHQASSRAAVEIEDHGQGIAPKDQEQIFFRNYTTAHKHAGSGLGLTIAKSLALQMEAELSVSSEQGKKTVFTLLLKC